MDVLSGVLTAMVTPFDRSGGIAFAALPEYLTFQRQSGIDGVVAAGTNGEGTSLSVNEKKQLLEAVLGLRDGMSVFAATGTANLPDTIELVRHAAMAGADAVLVLPSFFYKNPSGEGVANFFQRILEIAELPVLLYSIPQQSAIPITDEVLDLLRGHERLAGLKDSQGDWTRTSALISERSYLRVFSGSDELLLRSVEAGSAGAISGTANAFPELVAGVYKAHSPEGRAEMQRKLDAAKTILLQYPLIAAAKSVLAHRGVPRMWVRPPLVDLTEGQEAEMIDRLRAGGWL